MADALGVKGIEKLTSVRLAEILTERSAVSSEVITDALYAQDRLGESFAQVLVSGGHITEWDLAKIVTEHFNLPFLTASNYAVSDEAKKRLPKELLFKHSMVPLDVFGDLVCVAMPVMLAYDELQRIQKEHSCELFPYVGLINDNKKVLNDQFKDYKEWQELDQHRREEEAKKRAAAAPAAGAQATPAANADWMSIFDAGDAAIAESRKKPATPFRPPFTPRK